MTTTFDVMGKHRKPPTETVRMASELARRLNRIAAHRNVSLPDLLAELLGALVDKLEAQMLDEIARERKRQKEHP